MLGLFDSDGNYKEFITQGAKKYAVIETIKNEKIKKDDNIIKKRKEKSDILKITVAGVPKIGAKALKSLDDFRDDFVFEHKYTNKNLLIYVENQDEFNLTDYKGNCYNVSDKSGCSIIPTTYVLGKALEYCNLVSDNSSHRARYKE